MALSLDYNSGSVNNSTGTLTATVTTTAGSGVIVVAIISNASAVTSVTAPGLTFTSRIAVTSNPPDYGYEYTAPYTTNQSGTVVTVVMNAASFTTIDVFAIGGAATSSFFDPNVSLPGSAINLTGTTAGPAFSTTNANDFIFNFGIPGAGTETAGSGWTLLSGANFGYFQYQIVSSTQSSITPTKGTSNGAQVAIVDAVIAAGGAASPFANSMAMMLM
jgi:hypothetical protein